ncbi:alpha/beta fold hydrolase [Enterococcus pallens]|uniref:AB hydrolase-1 domain-containing protein n=1 Tax=Enterococcus pallens ATCC BAA-351 TaxID=1158607 RepID=R2SDZ4_9ENTE|nr:alpha/beta hydrolase [Enterococcus pallens]EOH91086.1 hypothetical protein UAU_03625 [Enterococcus pallens ATCC BAA-351]EOU16283.1 hypothetical protein I588_03939 [Enterococcus pallens ATCC BAA-351]OJG78975.1 hypothetical protein RV10_GL001098 [Enterococcus pallens]
MIVWIIAILLLVVLGVLLLQFVKDRKAAYRRLENYTVTTFESSFGTMSYVDEGSGEAILISHGIFGGYDQGMVSLKQVAGERCRKLAPSRFGYIGSALPSEPTPKNQALVFKELLDDLGIDQVYLLATSAGGAAGLRFALDFPERTKGLILLSSGAPDKKRTEEEIRKMGLQGPPPMIVNDFIMWFAMKYFSAMFTQMMGAKIEKNQLFTTMLPASPRKKGVAADTKVTNTDMTRNYEKYPLEELNVPLLVCHAKDDPMASYQTIEKLLARVPDQAHTAICESGGHIMADSGDLVDRAIQQFMNQT